MNRVFSVLSVIMLFLLLGCVSMPTSSGFLTESARPLPNNMPKKVVVLLFEGNPLINVQATEQFSSGLVDLGFEVIDRRLVSSMSDLSAGTENFVPSDSQGSGFLLSEAGYVVTNYHVVSDSSDIEIIFPRLNENFKGEIALKDEYNDIAVLKLKNFNFSNHFGASIPYTIASLSSTRLGQDVFTLGFPLGDILGREVKLSTGKIDALSGIKDDPRLLQISSPIQPGNSGGPLINRKGELVGIIVSSLNAKYFYETTDIIPQNVNFAVKSDYLNILISMIDGSNEIRTRPNLLSGKTLEEQIGLLKPFIVTVRSRGHSVFENSQRHDIEGIFTGDVTGESSPIWVDTHLNVKFTDLRTGKVIWSATTHDPRAIGWSMDIRTSIVYTTREALKTLGKDIYKKSP